MQGNWVCLNIHGLVKKAINFAAIGGIMRDRNGRWILGFNRYLGNYSLFDAELCGILDG